GHLANLQAETTQDSPNAQFHVQQPSEKLLARNQQRPDLLRSNRFGVHPLEPSHPQQLGKPTRILAVRLHRHRLQCRLHMPPLTNVSNPSFSPPPMPPLSNPPRLKPNPIHRNAKFLEETTKNFRLARDLRLLHDLASPIHNANAREFQRDVDSGIVLHGCPPSQMPGADSTS